MGSSVLTHFDDEPVLRKQGQKAKASVDDDDDLDWGEEGPLTGPRVDLVANNGAVRTARYDDRRRRRGQVRVSVWVPADRAGELREIAARMRG